MPAAIALPTGVVNEVESTSVVAIPAALAATAALIWAAICEATEFVEPVHFGVGMPSSLAQSARPYWVGTKKGLVVTWLTNQNCHDGVLGKAPEPLAPLAALLDELQAVSRADAAAVALTKPAPAISRRRVGLSLRLSVSIASSTLGSTFLAMRTSSGGGSRADVIVHIRPFTQPRSQTPRRQHSRKNFEKAYLWALSDAVSRHAEFAI